MRGRAHVYAQWRVSADEVFPARRQNGAAEEDPGRPARAGIDPGFAARVQGGDLLGRTTGASSG